MRGEIWTGRIIDGDDVPDREAGAQSNPLMVAYAAFLPAFAL